MKQNEQNPELNGNTPKKTYHTPEVKHYGSVTGLVQAQPNVGSDGATVFIDCTFS